MNSIINESQLRQIGGECGFIHAIIKKPITIGWHEREMCERERSVLECVAGGKINTRADMADYLDISLVTISKYIGILEDAGKIKKILTGGRGKFGYFVLTGDKK